MGKIQKIKQERKKLEVEGQIRKAKNRRRMLMVAFWASLLIIVLGSGLFVYRKYNPQIEQITSKIKGTLRITQGGDKPQESEKKMVNRKFDKAPDMKIDTSKTYTARFETNKGNFEIELFAKDAPKTVNNFVFLARERFYDGLIFHRVIKDFMIQGGDPEGNGSGGPGYKFDDEINPNKLVKGTLAMANSGPNTNGSQFFIVTKEATDWLDGKHTAFGKVTAGLDVVLAIGNSETGENDKPKSDIIIKSIEITEK